MLVLKYPWFSISNYWVSSLKILNNLKVLVQKNGEIITSEPLGRLKELSAIKIEPVPVETAN